MQNVSESEREQDPAASAARRRTWTHLPALRIGARAQWRTRKVTTAVEAAPEAAQARPALARPRLLRLWRALTGLVLLTVGWALALLTAEVFELVWRPLPRVGVLRELAFRLLGVAAMGFLVFVACCCLLVAAFALSLAVTRRDW